ncbi:hypothetical protein Trydic_g15941 [Trypoxylus dichotomus]
MLDEHETVNDEEDEKKTPNDEEIQEEGPVKKRKIEHNENEVPSKISKMKQDNMPKGHNNRYTTNLLSSATAMYIWMRRKKILRHQAK